MSKLTKFLVRWNFCGTFFTQEMSHFASDLNIRHKEFFETQQFKLVVDFLLCHNLSILKKYSVTFESRCKITASLVHKVAEHYFLLKIASG